MLYVLKMIVSFLLPPGLWIIMLLFLGVWLYRRHRKQALALILVALLCYLSSISLISDTLIRSLESTYVPPESPEGDVIIVLMGGSTLDTPGIAGPGHPSGETAGRLITTAALQQKLKLPIIVSGGQVYKDSGFEGDVGAQSLIAMGISQNQITVDRRSKSTTENAEEVKKLLQNSGYVHPILVTSANHMERAVQNFKRAGVAVTPYPTDYMVSKTFVMHSGHFAPSYEAVNKTGHALKEYLGLLALRF